MATNEERLMQRRAYAGPAFLKEGFRPLFLAAGAWAAVAAPLWIAVWAGAIGYRGSLDPLAWHVHEMIFGFVAAAIGGFLLTAVPNWPGRLPVRGGPLAALAVLWLLGRLAMWFGRDIGAPAAAVADLLFLGVLGGFIANEILAGRNWRNLPVLAGVLLLVAANALFHLPSIGIAETGDVGERLAIAVVLMLITLIGGRVVPSFTRNWLAKNDGPQIAGPMERFDRIALVVTLLSLILWVVLERHPATGGVLLAAALLNLVRLGRWAGWRTGAEPLVTALHIGYLWLGLGLAALAISILTDVVTRTAALHVLTIGAMGTMILAVTTRAILGHTGRGLHAGAGTVTIYALATAAVVARVAFEFVFAIPLLWLSAGMWSAAFVLFFALYGPMLFRGRADAGG